MVIPIVLLRSDTAIISYRMSIPFERVCNHAIKAYIDIFIESLIFQNSE